jgi:single-strand DNA-binding protein
MGTVNKVLLIGRLGKEPEERSTPGGTRVSQFSLATDTYHGDGEKTTDWHRVVAFGKTADLCNQYLQKGRLVCVDGTLRTRSWEKTPGEKRWITEVVVSKITFLGARSNAAAETQFSGEGDPEKEMIYA